MSRYDEQENGKLLNPVAVVLVVGLSIAIAGIYFLFQSKDDAVPQTEEQLSLPQPPPQIEPPLTTGQVIDEPEPAGQQGATPEESREKVIEEGDFIGQQEVLPLPPLAESDELFRNDLLNLSKELAGWVNNSHLIRKYLVIVNDFAQGMRLNKHMRFFTLDKPFMAARDEHGLYLDPRGYHRYDKLAAAINELDVPAALAMYNKYRPLLLEVFAGFGYPQGHQLEDLFKKAAAQILEAPVITERISLYRPSVRYKFNSSRLEKLSPVQKQMIRMGPENTKIIQDKVRSLIEALINQPVSEGETLG